MKNLIRLVVFAIFFLPAIVLPFAVHGAPARDAGANFSDMEGKEWVLSEFRSAGRTITMDRRKLEVDGFTGVFSIQFENNRVSGMGAPNRFFGPYTAGSNRALSLGNMASTLMAPIIEPEELKEHEYLSYLSNVTRWDFAEGKLELYSFSSSGAETVLVFTR
jgi:heat shock protein HslJ